MSVKNEAGKWSKGRLSHVERLKIGFTSTKADRAKKKIARLRKRLGRLHNGRQ